MNKMSYWADRMGLIFLTMAIYEATNVGLGIKVYTYVGLAFISLLVYFVGVVRPSDLPSYDSKQKPAGVSNTILFILKKNRDEYCLYTPLGEILLTFDEPELTPILSKYRNNNYKVNQYASNMSDEKLIVLEYPIPTEPRRGAHYLNFSA